MSRSSVEKTVTKRVRVGGAAGAAAAEKWDELPRNVRVGDIPFDVDLPASTTAVLLSRELSAPGVFMVRVAYMGSCRMSIPFRYTETGGFMSLTRYIGALKLITDKIEKLCGPNRIAWSFGAGLVRLLGADDVVTCAVTNDVRVEHDELGPTERVDATAPINLLVWVVSFRDGSEVRRKIASREEGDRATARLMGNLAALARRVSAEQHQRREV